MKVYIWFFALCLIALITSCKNEPRNHYSTKFKRFCRVVRVDTTGNSQTPVIDFDGDGVGDAKACTDYISYWGKRHVQQHSHISVAVAAYDFSKRCKRDTWVTVKATSNEDIVLITETLQHDDYGKEICYFSRDTSFCKPRVVK